MQFACNMKKEKNRVQGRKISGKCWGERACRDEEKDFIEMQNLTGSQYGYIRKGVIGISAGKN